MDADIYRIKKGFWLIVIALAFVAAIYLASMWRFSSAADVATSVGAVTTVVGTLVGAFFGVQAGAQGKEKAESARNEAEMRVRHLAGAMAPDDAARVLRELG